MRVVITGASGNVGTSLVRAFEGDDSVDEIVGLVRRRPSSTPPHDVPAPQATGARAATVRTGA